ncbi:pyridoxal phosphate-dependent aminotransferase family protein [Flagellimonas sp. 389]|uniref:aminotransferase class I/II-fold pyridoxal phosphate-dependent enzyme n=1 Tax=Flagellimonas sp. 389 TaxID=2835862 RepID=UPI001BD63240|nr:pyridoxal phosphate-dependent aminotransferase family protein [Flagellimonas sp. 389]MBS9462483.1 pyridoxal phosphate-dependent aminotransferase family protein [Flagellimonas sp. 389]
MVNLPKKLEQKLEKRRLENALRVLPEAQQLIDFSSNDYLGFAKKKEFSKQALNLLENLNLPENGASGSRLLTGNHRLYGKLENLLAFYHKSASALVFNSGYDANIGFFEAVPQKGDFIFYDELVHASIRDGIKMSNAKAYKFKHNAIGDLTEGIERSRNALDMNGEVYVVTESVFSMDGDSPNLKALSDFCTAHGYYLVVDEAHATGIFGEGKDLVCQLGIEEQVFARIITFGKALGNHGAAILGSDALKTYLVNFARSLIYTTALSPHALASILTAYSYLKKGSENERRKLQKNIEFFKNQAKLLGLSEDFIESNSAIHCIIIPGNEKVKQVSNKLQKEGFNVKPILSPTVKKGQERLRFCLHAYNTTEEISKVLSTTRNLIK